MRYLSLFLAVISLSCSLHAQNSEVEKTGQKPKKITVAAIPYINYSRTIDFSYGLMATGFYKINPKDTISPSSSTAIIGIYSTSKSYAAVLAQQFYLAEDSWRARIAIGTGNGNLQVYNDFYSGGQFIDYSNKMRFAILRLSRKVSENLFLGISGSISNSRTEFDIELPIINRRPVIDIPLNSLGTFLQSDTRNNVNFPSEGHNILIDYKNFGDWLGNENTFNKMELTYDYYKNFGSEDRVLLARFYSSISFGDVPFIGQQTVGGDDIRGYSEGRYRDDELYSVQAEYRHKFKSRFGVVAFGGFATVVPEISEFFQHDLLPGIGAGVRYRLLEKEKINIGVDVATGKKDWSLSFRISDAFTR